MAQIRTLRRGDSAALYDICLKTGDSGKDATALYRDPELLGHVYAGPYPALEPESGFVLEDEEGAGGYIIGARDTAAFEALQEREWWPALRARYPDPDALPAPDRHMAELIHKPERSPRRISRDYPAHLHIDLLPRFQGKGWGKRMMDRWLAMMREGGAVGVHLGVGTSNERAVRFYNAYGFGEIARWERGILMGLKL